jgi:predicted nucleic acid-binding protein
MILVDTSIWIEWMRPTRPLAFDEVVAFDDVVVCLPIIQELLQGLDDETWFRGARDALLSLPILESPLHDSLFLEAVALYRTARRAGYSIRSSTDCLIAACALRHDAEVLHHDRDFDHLAQVSHLRQRRM